MPYSAFEIYSSLDAVHTVFNSVAFAIGFPYRMEFVAGSRSNAAPLLIGKIASYQIHPSEYMDKLERAVRFMNMGDHTAANMQMDFLRQDFNREMDGIYKITKINKGKLSEIFLAIAEFSIDYGFYIFHCDVWRREWRTI